MTGQPERPRRRFEHLEDLTVEQLEELLSAGVDISEGDDAYVDAIIEEIVRKEHKSPTGRLPDVDEAWRSFQEDFHTEEGEGLSLYPDEAEEERPVSLAEAAPARKVRKSWWKFLTAAAVIFLVLAVTVAPPALGYRDFFEMIGHWNPSIFSFFGVGREPETTEGPGEVIYDSLEEALEDNGVTTPVVPKMSDDYEVIEINVQRFPEMGKIDYHAFYKNGSKTISIHIIQREREMSRQIERDENYIDEYIVNDVVHYLFSNNGKLWTAWYRDNLECSFQGELSIEELITMIDSIYER